MLKIPFALEPLSGELVDVGQVKSGRDCGCQCPSCGQSVIARQGDINQWHFAHDSKASVPPHCLCEISFYACCKRYVIEQLVKNEFRTLSTPAYQVTEKQFISARGSYKSMSLSMGVTESRKLTVDGFGNNGNFDLAVSVGAHTVDIVLGHPDRSQPDIHSGDNGVLLVDLKFIADRYQGTHTTADLIRESVEELFGEDIEHKRWLFHPRESAVRARLAERLNSELNGISAMKVQHCTPPAIGRPQPVSCKMCKREWVWIAGEPLTCEACNTHMYVVLTP